MGLVSSIDCRNRKLVYCTKGVGIRENVLLVHFLCVRLSVISIQSLRRYASEMTYIVSGGALKLYSLTRDVVSMPIVNDCY